MPKKYHIDVKPTPLKTGSVSKFKLERGESCINCGKCAKVCIYYVHKRREDDPRVMADPVSPECRNCFRCIQECPRGAIIKSLMPEFKALGGSYWKPDMILSLWKQAGDGKVPVSGAGYRGPFTGPFFDSMWTDMSEIVRPTRDGIHGREYISTSVDVGRKLNHLAFDGSGNLLSDVPKTVDLPIPIIFDFPLNNPGEKMKIMAAAAAAKLNTFIVFPAEEISRSIMEYSGSIIPLISHDCVEKNSKLIKNSRIIEIQYADRLLDNFTEIKNEIKNLSDALVAVRIPAAGGVESMIPELVKSGAEVIHLAADYRGMETNSQNPRFIKDVIKAVHFKLVENKIRDEVTIIASGGIAMAEHVPKAIIMGADLTAIDIPVLLAVGGRLYENETPGKMIVFPDEFENIPEETGMQRIVNLMGAWHSQLLEVMGAMGIREVRRLRGEAGRAIFFEEIDNESFGKIFKEHNEK
jgi:ferredoxin